MLQATPRLLEHVGSDGCCGHPGGQSLFSDLDETLVEQMYFPRDRSRPHRLESVVCKRKDTSTGDSRGQGKTLRGEGQMCLYLGGSEWLTEREEFSLRDA